MEELYAIFRDKLYYAGFMQRRQYKCVKGKKVPSRNREWCRCYAEVRGPFLYCWRAGACDVDGNAISRLKQESTNSQGISFPPIDTRTILIEEMDDYKMDQSVQHCLSISFALGQEQIHWMAPNSTGQKEWKNSLIRAGKEAMLLDQRWTAALLTTPGVPLFSETVLPEPNCVNIMWYGSAVWKIVSLCVQVKRGFSGSNVRGRKSSKCLYIYEDPRLKKCLARISNITQIYGIATTSTSESFEFIIEGTGKLKSGKLDGLKATIKTRFSINSQELLVKWISILKNCFEIPNSASAIANNPQTNNLTSGFGINRSNSSDLSMRSTMDSNNSGPLILPAKKPWEKIKSASPPSISQSTTPVTLRQRSKSFHDQAPRDERLDMMLAQQRREEEIRRYQYGWATRPQTPANPSSYAMPYQSPMMGYQQPMPMPMMQMPMPFPMMPMQYQPYNIPPMSRNMPMVQQMPASPPRRSKSTRSVTVAAWETESLYDQSTMRQSTSRTPSSASSIFGNKSPQKSQKSESGASTSSSSSTLPSIPSILGNVIQVRPYASLPCRHLYDSYVQYCRERGHPIKSDGEVRQAMLDCGYSLKATTGTDLEPLCWHHVSIKTHT